MGNRNKAGRLLDRISGREARSLQMQVSELESTTRLLDEELSVANERVAALDAKSAHLANEVEHERNVNRVQSVRLRQAEDAIESRERRLHPFIQSGLEEIPLQDRQRTSTLACLHEECLLSQKFDQHGSDKGARHSYARRYCQLLQDITSPRILEVGLGSINGHPYGGPDQTPGGSLAAWRATFPSATICGGDIDPESVASASEQSFEVDQTSRSSLEQFRKQVGIHGPFDLIIDDGFHDFHANVNTFLELFPLLADQGAYVIEDVHASLVHLWRLVCDSLPGFGDVLDLSAERPGVDDNVLVVFRKHLIEHP